MLFDLDNTLLEIDGDGFLDAYVDALTAWWRPPDPEVFRHQIMAASVPIFSSHPDRTNGDVFRDHLARTLGISSGDVGERMAAFHRGALGDLRVSARPRPGARTLVQHCLALGLRVAVATTPIYTPEVIALRLQWAGLQDVPWDLVTHSEVMHTCKPDVAYFHEVAALLGMAPQECCMVGDDPLQDGPAQAAGMTVLLRATPDVAGWHSLREVDALVRRQAVPRPLARRSQMLCD